MLQNNKNKNDLLKHFINNSKKDKFEDKVATIKTLMQVDKERFENALKSLILKQK